MTIAKLILIYGIDVVRGVILVVSSPKFRALIKLIQRARSDGKITSAERSQIISSAIALLQNLLVISK